MSDRDKAIEERCPQCRATDNNPYITESGVAMRACGRCLIQWQALNYHAKQNAEEHTLLKLLTDIRYALLKLLTDIRYALGDNGKRMQDEFVEYCKEIREKAEKLAKLEAFVNGLAEVGWRHTDGLWASILWCDDIYWVRTERRKWADGQTPLEAIYAYLEQAEGGEE